MSGAGYRGMLGWLLLWSVLPLPFLYIVLPSFWLVACGAAALLVARPSATYRIPAWGLNLLGLAIVAAVLVAGGFGVGPLRPLGHLLLLLTSVRAVVVTDRQSFLRALLPTFLVWVVSVTSSTHVTVVLYIAASAAIWWWAGVRIQLAGLARDGELVPAGLPRVRHAVAAAMVALMVMVPLFVAIPRLRSPLVAGRGGSGSVTGFSSHVDLAGVGTIRQSHEIALTVRRGDGSELDERWMRFRATALERVMRNSWTPRGAILEPNERGGLVWPHPDRMTLDDTVELEIEILRPRRYLFQPEGTVAVASPIPVLSDPSGGIVLARRVRGSLTYTVWVARGSAPLPKDAPPARAQDFDLHPEVRRLRDAVVAGAGTDRERAEAIETYLQENFSYSMEGMTSVRADPVTWFLLEEQAGHCEYFAGAMVAMLDDLGIPARMVTGYSGGDLLGAGDEAVVRESNAHAWVEARVGSNGEWVAFDPTPADDVPALTRPKGRDLFRFAWDWVQTGWDRYVLTFGFGEQVQLLTVAASGVDALTRLVSWPEAAWISAIIAAAAVLGWWLYGWRPRRRRRAGPPAARAVQRVADRLHAEGIAVPARATVRWIARTAADRWPAAASAVRELAFRAERELYAADRPLESDRSEARRLWLKVVQAMRQ
jgi:transglutaminase-like putative cysteine protease